MKRWILARATCPEKAVVQRPQGRGAIAATPVWIDTHEAVDYYAKQVRKGILEVLLEADAKPAPTPPPAEPTPTKKPTPRGRQED